MGTLVLMPLPALNQPAASPEGHAMHMHTSSYKESLGMCLHLGTQTPPQLTKQGSQRVLLKHWTIHVTVSLVDVLLSVTYILTYLLTHLLAYLLTCLLTYSLESPASSTTPALKELLPVHLAGAFFPGRCPENDKTGPTFECTRIRHPTSDRILEWYVMVFHEQTELAASRSCMPTPQNPIDMPIGGRPFSILT